MRRASYSGIFNNEDGRRSAVPAEVGEGREPGGLGAVGRRCRVVMEGGGRAQQSM